MPTLNQKHLITNIAGKGFSALFGFLSELIPVIGPLISPLVAWGTNKFVDWAGDKIISNQSKNAINTTPFRVPNKLAFLNNNPLPVSDTIRNFDNIFPVINNISSHDPTEFTHGKQIIDPRIGIQKSNNTDFPVYTNENPNASFGTSGFTYKNKNIKFKNVI